jgi:hypothetical protein
MALCIGVFPFADRLQDLGRISVLGQDIYQQQYQSARFLATYYSGQTVAVNDIGLASWAGNVHVLDLWGLGSGEVAQLRAHNQYTPDRIREITTREGAEIAVVYPGWFVTHGGLPDEWVPAGHWQVSLDSKANVGAALLFFFPLRRDGMDLLRKNLYEYASQLPPGVKAGF